MPSRRMPVREADLFKALGHPVRLQILWILTREEACVCHLEAQLRMRQAYLSQQLAVLRAAGLVSERRIGPYVYYRARDPQVSELLELVHKFTGSADLGVRDVDPSICSCPRCVVLGQPLAGLVRTRARPAAASKGSR